MWVVWVGLGCSKAHDDAPVAKDVPAVPRDAAAVVIASASPDAAAPAAKVFVTGSGRCGECHGKMFDEWETSAHARSVSSPVYKAAATAANDPACEHCHAPLAASTPRDGVASEGVTCDVCHTLRDPVPSAAGGAFRLAIEDMVKFGPRCDLKNHYFHRMGCSPEHREAALCGSCHWWEPKGLPVFTEYLDWKLGPAAAKDVPCQGCHMPKERAALATGSPVRTGVPHHGLLGVTGDLRARALGLEVTVRAEGNALAVAVTLTNAGAGHSIPSGLPERRVVVRVRVLDAAGKLAEQETRALGRVLVDAKGIEAPFWLAKRVGSDTRIPAGGTWKDAFAFHPAGAGTIEVEVVHRALSDSAAKLLGITDVTDAPMVAARIPIGPQVRLPKTVTIRPAAEGKRR